MKTEKYVGIKLRAFGHGMQTLFEGVAEVFSSIGVEIPESLMDQQARWSGNKNEVDTLVQVPRDDEPGDEEPVGTVKQTGTAEKMPSETLETEPAKKEEAPKKKNMKPDASTGVTQDDITKIIVQKVKQDRGNSAKAEQLLKSYGAARVSELDPSQYEAFITDLAAL